MKIRIAIAALLLLVALAATAGAEVYQVAWEPVTAYADGTPLEQGTTVAYAVYWTKDPAFTPASLHAIATGTPVTTASFDVATSGMSRGETIYFTCRSTLSSGEVSDLAAGLSWPVPRRKPSSPGNSKIIKIR